MIDVRAVSERIKTHLETQKARSIMPNSSRCAYRGENGTMCAVGCLITDEVYSAANFIGDDADGTPGNRLEELTIDSYLVSTAVEQSLGEAFDNSSPFRVLKNWQSYHDSWCFIRGSGDMHSYKAWIDGRPGSTSPQQMHDKLMEVYNADAPNL